MWVKKLHNMVNKQVTTITQDRWELLESLSWWLYERWVSSTHSGGRQITKRKEKTLAYPFNFSSICFDVWSVEAYLYCFCFDQYQEWPSFWAHSVPHVEWTRLLHQHAAPTRSGCVAPHRGPASLHSYCLTEKQQKPSKPDYWLTLHKMTVGSYLHCLKSSIDVTWEHFFCRKFGCRLLQ